ncbi:MAG TPA: hypothetical protein VK826_00305 [Bacteroidia bacterium]|nr:hypothetical protein [Bacteroidia bacterium]
MVSPSSVIDQVWHLHLIYTKSYDTLCELIGKKVQHIPATHNPEEGNRYVDARQRTHDIYQHEFGTPPADIWSARTMMDTLNLTKARFKLRTVIIATIVAFAVLCVPFYFLLQPVYIYIANPDFIISYALLFAAAILFMEFFNRVKLAQVFSEFEKISFVNRLTPQELIYLQRGRTESVINGHINHLVNEGHIKIRSTDKVEAVTGKGFTTQEESQIMQLLSSGRAKYTFLLRKLTTRAVFANLAVSMDAFVKYFQKSGKFHRLFYINLAVYAFICMLGFERIVIGAMRDKPVVFISLIVILALIISAILLYRLSRVMFTRIIPGMYRQKIEADPMLQMQWDWQYFLAGTAVYSVAFAVIADMSTTETVRSGVIAGSNHGGGSSCGSSCGSSQGSSCGSSCGGGSCGGCGGGGD